VLNRDAVAGKDREENEEVLDALNVEEDLFWEEKLVTALKGLKNNKAPGSCSVLKEFFKWG